MENNIQTLSQVTTLLTKNGYTSKIQLLDNKRIELDNQAFNQNEIKINKVYRFEGMSNPSDTSICYAIESNTGKKGILIDAYGVDASDKIANFIKDIEIDNR